MFKSKAGERGLCFLKNCSQGDMASFLPNRKTRQGTAGKGLGKSYPDLELEVRVSSTVLELKCSHNQFSSHRLPS